MTLVRSFFKGVGSIGSSIEIWPEPGRYWQGMYLGLERIWVGNVVRLQLKGSQTGALLDTLAAKMKLDRKIDADSTPRDLGGSYVIRRRAILKIFSRETRESARLHLVRGQRSSVASIRP